MANFQVIINSRIYKLIPLGYCECGCGRKTKISPKTRRRERHTKGMPIRFIHGHHAFGKKGELHPGWKGGRRMNMGYVDLYAPDHPRARKGYVFEHVLVMEKILGRSIGSDEHIHHLNGKRDDNSPGNLIVFRTKAGHHAYEERLKAFKECGHYDWWKCPYCHQYDSLANLTISKKFVYHKPCINADQRRRHAAKKAAVKEG